MEREGRRGKVRCTEQGPRIGSLSGVCPWYSPTLGKEQSVCEFVDLFCLCTRT